MHLMLILLDPKLTDDTRQEAAVEAEELLAGPGTREAAEDILYAHPLPSGADPAGALTFCSGEAPRTTELLSQLFTRQSLIAEVQQAWEQVPDAEIGSAADREYVQATFVREGLFRSMVLLREAQQAVDGFLVSALLNREVQKLTSYRAILQSWVEPFRRESARPLEVAAAADVIAEEHVPYRRSFDRQDRFTKVQLQKASIVGAMKARDLRRARSYVSALIDLQTSGGLDPIHACMSLCDLALDAKSVGMLDLQLELSQTATKLKEDDAWSWVQYADALLDAGHLNEALPAAESAIVFGALDAGKTIRAKVLRAMNRLGEALAAYDEVIGDFPENVVARTGRAETLRSMDRLVESLAAYDAVIVDFPWDLSARNGKAEVLHSMNRLVEALAAYEGVIVDSPQNVVARNGKAQVLRSMNRLEEVWAADDEAITAFPDDADYLGIKVVPGFTVGARTEGWMATRDQEVVSLFLHGDAEAVGTIDSWISRAAWPYQRRLSHVWENVLQNVRLEVIRLLGQGKFRGESSLRTYLWQVVSNSCLDQLRSQGRWQWADLMDDSVSAPAPPVTGGHEDRDPVQRMLGRIPAECREVWRLIAMGHSYREMSRRLGVAEGTLRVRVLRCREKAIALRGELLAGRRK